eukprot:UN03754
MERLLTVPGCREKDAYYISKQYKTMNDLLDAYDECVEKWDNKINYGYYKCSFYSCKKINPFEYKFCPYCGMKRHIDDIKQSIGMKMDEKESESKPELMLHNTVNVCGEWIYREELMKKKLCDSQPNQIIQSLLFDLRNDKQNALYGKEEPISKRLSKRMYRTFGVEEVVELDSDLDSDLDSAVEEDDDD